MSTSRTIDRDYAASDETARLFIAVRLPSAVQRDIEDAAHQMRALAGLKWVPTEQLHLTLRFLGETRLARVPGLASTLAARLADLESFEIRLADAGAFPNPQRARVVWIGVEPSPALLEAHAAVEQSLGALGITPDPRAFRPHITLARVRDGASSGLPSAIDALRFSAAVRVSTVSLMRSELTPRGALHEEIHSAHLGRPGDAE